MDLTVAELNWVRRLSLSVCRNLNVRFDEEFESTATVALWKTKFLSGLTGRDLFRRARAHVRGSIVDDIRQWLGRPGSVRASRELRKIEVTPNLAIANPEAGPFQHAVQSEARELLDRIVLSLNEQQQRAFRVLMNGGTHREAAETVGREKSWVSKCLLAKVRANWGPVGRRVIA